jgi:hypothetical protein
MCILSKELFYNQAYIMGRATNNLQALAWHDARHAASAASIAEQQETQQQPPEERIREAIV